MNAIYTLNAAKNGVEIRFDSKPAADVLEAIKAAGYRWSRTQRLWWARQNEKTLAVAKQIASEGVPQENGASGGKPDKSDKAAQAALKAEYLDILARDVWPNDTKMIEFERRQIARIVRLECGGMVALEKPHIETNFCFGYSDSAYDTEDYDRANAMVGHALTHEEYFISENMRKIGEKIADLKEPGIYSRNGYCTTPKAHVIRALEWPRYGEELPEGAQPITEKDRAALIEAWEKVGTDFRRRLDSYLKRYGMSKVNAWSYWRDE